MDELFDLYDELGEEFDPQTVWLLAKELKESKNPTRQATGEILLRLLNAHAVAVDPVSVG